MLVAFLNAVLKPTEEKLIQSLSYTNSELNRENAEDKKASLDIRAETKDGGRWFFTERSTDIGLPMPIIWITQSLIHRHCFEVGKSILKKGACF